MNSLKRQRAVETGIDLVSSFSAKAFEELIASYFGDSSRPITSPAGLILRNSIKFTLQDVSRRVWSPNEVNKIKTVIDSALLEINSRLDGGLQPRDDGFFTDEQSGRAQADEILEGVLLKARDQHEEKKLIYLGYFFANLAFRSDVSGSLANYFIKTANALSYRQFVLLRHIADSMNEAFNAEPIRGRSHSLPDLTALAKEEMELHSAASFGGYGLLNGVTSYTDVVSELGQTFIELFNLKLIPNEDIRELRQLIILCEDSPPIGETEVPY